MYMPLGFRGVRIATDKTTGGSRLSHAMFPKGSKPACFSEEAAQAQLDRGMPAERCPSGQGAIQFQSGCRGGQAMEQGAYILRVKYEGIYGIGARWDA